MYFDDVSPMTEETTNLLNLLNQCKKVNAFEFEGVVFLGYEVDAVKEYRKRNPSDSFYVWLHDRYPILTKCNNVKA